MQCENWSWADSDREWTSTECHATPDRVFLNLVLPLLFGVLALFGLFLAYRYNEKKKMRILNRNFPPEPLEQLTVRVGRFTAGADDYTCTRDVCPIILPKSAVWWWRTEDGVLRGVQLVSMSLCLISCILLPLGLFTRIYGRRSSPPNTLYMASVGLLMSMIACVLCLFACICRSTYSLRARRWQRVQELCNEEMRAQGGQPVQMVAVPMQQMPVGHVAIPMPGAPVAIHGQQYAQLQSIDAVPYAQRV